MYAISSYTFNLPSCKLCEVYYFGSDSFQCSRTLEIDAALVGDGVFNSAYIIL